MLVSDVFDILATGTWPTQAISYTATAGNSSTYPVGPTGLVVFSSQLCFIEIGEGVTATSSSFPIAQNTVYRFQVPKGTGAAWRVSAIRNGTDGTIWVRPFTLK